MHLNPYLKAYLQLIRAPGLCSIISNTLASFIIIFSLSAIEISLFSYLPILLVSLLLYQAGMIMNDLADLEEDSIERPHRPLPSQKIPKVHALAYTITLIIFALIIAAFASKALFLMSCLLLASIMSYNLLSKSSPLGPINMAAIRAINWTLAASLIPSQAYLQHYELILTTALVFAYTLVICLLSQYETASIPLKLKYQNTTIYGIALFIILTLLKLGHLNLLGSLLLMSFIGFLVYLNWTRITVQNSLSANSTQLWITQLLKWMVILDGLILCSYGEWFTGLACCTLLLLSGRLAKSIYMT